MSKDIGIIYGLVCPKSKIIRYIGQTIQEPNKRLYQHINQSSKLNSHLGYWLKSISILNKQNEIKLIVLEDNIKYNDLNLKEIYWEEIYKNNNLVNSMIAHEKGGHHTHSEETKRIIGIKTTERQIGIKKSIETKNKISISHKGKTLSIETINKIQESRKWYKHSEITKEKIKLSNKGKIRTDEQKENLSKAKIKPIYVYDKIENNMIITSIKEFALLLKVYPNSISDRLNKYKEKFYKERYLLSRSEGELIKLLKQLQIG